MIRDLVVPSPTFDDAGLWAHKPVRIEHRLHASALFSRESLAELIGRYPREHYSLIATGARGGQRMWREGDLGGLSGEQVFEAIAKGRMWLNLRNVSRVDPRYRELLDRLFDEIAACVPGFGKPKRECGILISSPAAQVYYHADLPGQCLWQISGRKRVYVYPPKPPFVTQAQLEDIALFDVEVDLPYSLSYDEHAQIFDLGPGQALHWPLNAPHRVENVEGVNVSLTVSYTSEKIHRAQLAHLANGILRHRFGFTPRSHAIDGPSFWAKFVLQKFLRDSAWVKRQRRARRTVDFCLHRTRLGEISDLKVAA